MWVLLVTNLAFGYGANMTGVITMQEFSSKETGMGAAKAIKAQPQIARLEPRFKPGTECLKK